MIRPAGSQCMGGTCRTRGSGCSFDGSAYSTVRSKVLNRYRNGVSCTNRKAERPQAVHTVSGDDATPCTGVSSTAASLPNQLGTDTQDSDCFRRGRARQTRHGGTESTLQTLSPADISAGCSCMLDAIPGFPYAMLLLDTLCVGTQDMPGSSRQTQPLDLPSKLDCVRRHNCASDPWCAA